MEFPMGDPPRGTLSTTADQLCFAVQPAASTASAASLARIIHEARGEGAESAEDSRPSDRRPPEAYLQYVEDGRREEVAKMLCYRRPQ